MEIGQKSYCLLSKYTYMNKTPNKEMFKGNKIIKMKM